MSMHAQRPVQQRRHILLSAYACSPLWGSEPGVGWQWALELSKRHDVTVITHRTSRKTSKRHWPAWP